MNILTPDEIATIQICLQGNIDDLNDCMKNPSIPFTPAARKDMRRILALSQSALVKIQTISGCSLHMDPLKPGDEQEFFTKES